MDIDNFARNQKMIQLQENLLAVEDDRADGHKGGTVDELETFLDFNLASDCLMRSGT